MLDEQTPAETGDQQEPTTETPGATAPESTDAPAAKKAPARKRAPRKTAAKKPAEAPDTGTDTGEAPAGDAPAPVDEASAPAKKAPARKRTAKKAVAPIPEGAETSSEDAAPAAPAKKTATRSRKKAVAAPVASAEADQAPEAPAEEPAAEDTGRAKPPVITPLFQPPVVTTTTRRTRTPRKVAAPAPADEPLDLTGEGDAEAVAAEETSEKPAARTRTRTSTRSRGAAKPAPETDDELEDEELAAEGETADGIATADTDTDDNVDEGDDDSDDAQGEGGTRRRRRRGGRRRRKSGSGGGGAGSGDDSDDADDADDTAPGDAAQAAPAESGEQGEDGDESSSSRRRRRRRRSGEGGSGDAQDDPDNTTTRVRRPRTAEDEITGFSGSTRLEAKKQRRREGREAGRRRAPIISEAEFLARRESVDRAMVIRQRADLTQIAVLEDRVLVEHYVARESQTSIIGNVYLGRVQNVLPSMEAAFIDIGHGRNAVLYAGEVNWDALGAKDGSQRKIEQVLKSGQSVLVQVSKDPIGHKGARLTSQISLPGRFLVYVPDGTTSGISRKLPDTERTRLKTLLKEIVPDTAGVIVRTAAEGASEEELTRDVERLKALWESIAAKVDGGNAPKLLYGEPDLTLKVVRDLFTEDFGELVVSGDDAWDMVSGYVEHVAPELRERVRRHDESAGDVFGSYRIDEQIAKALDRKVWLPSGGSLVIDRTEAMTVVDVNTGKFTGSGGNLEETVTKNNLEAAEEIVRQLRLRDIGGIIVVDFIDMVLESNRDLVLRRLVECLGRDRTRHQVAEVTSLGLVQMTRKRIGTGLLEAFSDNCAHCQGRGLITHPEPVDTKKRGGQSSDEAGGNGGGGGNTSGGGNGGEGGSNRSRRNRGRGRGGDDSDSGSGDAGARQDQGGRAAEQAAPEAAKRPTPAEFAAMARHEAAEAAEAAKEAAAADDRADDRAEPNPEPVVEQVAEPVEVTEPEPEPEPAPPVSSGPRIVTSTRRVGARRAAGPPKSAVSTPVEPSVTTTGGDAETGVDEGVDGRPQADAPAHVPIKKKGSRKR